MASQVEPGQQVLEVTLEDEVLRIPLDATLSPVAQAERLFKRAAKLERAARFIPQRRQQLRADLAFVDQLGYDLAQATNQPEIAAVRAALVGAGLLPAGKRLGVGNVCACCAWASAGMPPAAFSVAPVLMTTGSPPATFAGASGAGVAAASLQPARVMVSSTSRIPMTFLRSSAERYRFMMLFDPEDGR